MKLMLGVLSLLVTAASFANAQTIDEVEISVGGFEVATNGAEKAQGVWLRTEPLIIGKPTVGTFRMRGCGDFSIAFPPNTLDANATVGWRVEVTPTRVVNHAVTFRLRWVRALNKGSELSPTSEDVEVTLKPGESRPLDSVPVLQTGVTTSDGRPCNRKAASLRVVADFPDLDRRLIGADVWLVKRLPNGKEESQLQSLRGLPHRPIPFYFDGIFDGTKRLDIFGKLVADPQQDRLEIAVETVGGEAHPGQPRGYQSTYWFRSTLRMKPDETVEIALKQPAGKTDTFANPNRVFSIRIRAKQIR
jgi:hypothetical protein